MASNSASPAAFASDSTDQRITVPADVIGEWWRGRTDVRARILESVDVEPLTEAARQMRAVESQRRPPHGLRKDS